MLKHTVYNTLNMIVNNLEKKIAETSTLIYTNWCKRDKQIFGKKNGDVEKTKIFKLAV